MLNKLVNVLDIKGWDYLIEKRDGIKYLSFYLGNECRLYTEQLLNLLGEDATNKIINEVTEW